SGEPLRIIDLFPGRTGSSRRACEWLVGFRLPLPENINPSLRESIHAYEGMALARLRHLLQNVEPEFSDRRHGYQLNRLTRVTVIVAGHQGLVLLAAQD